MLAAEGGTATPDTKNKGDTCNMQVSPLSCGLA